MFKLFKNFTKKDIAAIITCIALIVFQVWLDLRLPDYMSEITKLVQTEGSTILEILVQGGYMMACAFGSLLSSFVVGYIASKLSANFSYTLRGKVYNKVLSFGTEEIKNFQTSSLITRTTNDVTQLEMIIAMGLQMLIKAPIMAVWAVSKILNKSLEWSLLTGFFVVLLLVVISIIMIIVLPRFERVQKLIDNINNVEDIVGERGLTFTLHDPVYGGEKFSPAIIGNGTTHKYLLYFDSKFPFVHQNIVTINLGTSYTVNQGVDVFSTMNSHQGSYIKSTVTYPTGLVEQSADNLHTATYMKGSRESSLLYADRYEDDYTNVATYKAGKSKVGYSFVIGLIAVIMSYLIGVPLGILMARKKDKLVDKIGTLYIVFIIAVPSLAYIFLFKAIGGSFGLPTTFDMESPSKLMYVLPIVSLALPSIANLMKWIRRYMIDQMNSDYVKFARSGGLTEGEIFSKHILKNAAIPIIQGIPAAVLGALTGAIITERVYVVPGIGNLLTEAINKYDNGVIVGGTLFYAILTVASLILGDVLMAMVDPRISFSTKDR